MPKGGVIPTTERRSWLERYEQGASIDTIAKESGRTQRTVTAQLGQARQERQHDQVQVDLIRDAYRQHYGDLLEVAEEMAQRCESPDSRGILPEHAVEPDTRMLYEALRSHVPGSRLWSGVKTWEESSRDLAATSEQARAKIEGLVQLAFADYPEVLEDGFTESLRTAVMTAAQGLDQTVEYQRDPSGDSMQLRRGNFMLADGVQTEDRLDEIEERYGELLDASLNSESASRLRRLWASWTEARDIIRGEVQTLRLRRIITGQCVLCPGGEGSGKRRPRRRRGDG